MAKQSERKTCEIYISPDERQLLAQVAARRGVGNDYLARLAAGSRAEPAPKRPMPRLSSRRAAGAAKSGPRRAHSPAQVRHCRTCTRLQPSSDARRAVCAVGIWTNPMLAQSIRTSRRLRALSCACPQYEMVAVPLRRAPRHCRACIHLAAADTSDERYVCGRGMWTKPMKPLSVANAHRLACLSATCPDFEPTAGRWLPRS